LDGGKSYLVGGFVRDLIEGRPGKDIDLMVSGMGFDGLGKILRSLPAKRLGIRRILPAGKAFPVYKVRTAWAEEDIDVALARSERSMGTGHRGELDVRKEDVEAREDAARRDLTINSLLIALRTERGRLTGSVVDFFGGLEDLRRKFLRGVGKPEDRLREDPLRLLRAIRQKNELRGYSIEKKTWAAIRRVEPDIVRSIPGERVIGELLLSLSENPQGSLEDLRRAGILAILLPETVARDRRLARIRRRYAILEKSLGRPLPETPLLANLLLDTAREECDSRMRKAFPKVRRGRMHMLAKEDEKQIFRLSRTEAIARRLHFPGIRSVVRMLKDLSRLANSDRMRNRHARIESIFGGWESPDGLWSLYRADCRTSGRNVSDFRTILKRAARRPPVLSGKDLLKLGIPAAPRMEEILEELREATLAGRVKSRKEGMNLVLSMHRGEKSDRGFRRRINPDARRAIAPAGDRAGTGKEVGRKKTLRKIPRRSPGRSG
jgi:poly(A) polymerase